ncbi:conserved exported hypothetical protein [Candidatus Methylobacter favarea]|uniref:Uncharacterized protein n=1 Tax=Candidatus Methylobacter favarea TaxID=2707345 RepID=A0A8S0WH21_9GAMM|nr:hypothetical protein [Candidatus Methylobacter favarea]CAA9889509.1 conserved exported hypothetical protein [Candidatus Methylobacter favarea]
MRMVSLSRKFLILLLAMLQLIAPLVHAHAGEKTWSFGLHVPGLELYGIEHDGAMLQAVKTLQCKAPLVCGNNAEGILIGVDAGIKDKHINTDGGSDHTYYLYQQILALPTPVSPFDTNFSPQSQQFVGRLLIPSLSARSPPA